MTALVSMVTESTTRRARRGREKSGIEFFRKWERQREERRPQERPLLSKQQVSPANPPPTTGGNVTRPSPLSTGPYARARRLIRWRRRSPEQRGYVPKSLRNFTEQRRNFPSSSGNFAKHGRNSTERRRNFPEQRYNFPEWPRNVREQRANFIRELGNFPRQRRNFPEFGHHFLQRRRYFPK